jgi:hypothetical protein
VKAAPLADLPDRPSALSDLIEDSRDTHADAVRAMKESPTDRHRCTGTDVTTLNPLAAGSHVADRQATGHVKDASDHPGGWPFAAPGACCRDEEQTLHSCALLVPKGAVVDMLV